MYIVLVVDKIMDLTLTAAKSAATRAYDYLFLFVFVFVAFLGGVIQIYVPVLLPWSLNRVPNLLWYLLLGRLIVRFKLMDNLIIRPFFLIPAWLLLVVVASRVPHVFYFGTYWNWYIGSLAISAAGCWLSMSTAKFLNSNCRCLEGFLTKLGCASLGIMLVHKFWIVPIQAGYNLIAKMEWWFVVAIVLGISICVSLLSMLVTFAMRRWVPVIIGEG